MVQGANSDKAVVEGAVAKLKALKEQLSTLTGEGVSDPKGKEKKGKDKKPTAAAASTEGSQSTRRRRRRGRAS